MSIGEGHTLPFFVPFCIIIPFAQVAGGVGEWSSGLEVGDGISVSWTVVCIIIPLAQVNGGWMGEGLWIG
ncbi:hypothetical protein SAMN02744102_02793 [Paenibacillus barengoltzii]|nr:hypothetical protein SAMN02744102_02793 [Paenibacillus barengoltzii]